MRLFALLALVSAVLPAQSTEVRTFRLRSETTAQDFQEIASAALMMSDLVTAKSSDAAQREFTASGTEDQLLTVAWLVSELDRPASATPLPSSAIYTMKVKEPENTLRVFYPSQVASAQDLGEVSTAIRTISDIRRVAIHVSGRAIVVRGTPEQVEFVEWMLTELNRDAPGETHVYPQKDPRKENRVRIVRVPRAKDLQAFNEAQTMLRTLTDIRRVYPYAGKRIIAMRGTEEQVDLAKWVLAQLDKDLPAAQGSASPDYATQDGQIVKLFYFNGSTALQAFNETQTSIRTTVGIRQVYPHGTFRTLGARGTPAQIAQVSTLLPK